MMQLKCIQSRCFSGNDDCTSTRHWKIPAWGIEKYQHDMGCSYKLTQEPVPPGHWNYITFYNLYLLWGGEINFENKEFWKQGILKIKQILKTRYFENKGLWKQGMFKTRTFEKHVSLFCGNISKFHFYKRCHYSAKSGKLRCFHFLKRQPFKVKT